MKNSEMYAFIVVPRIYKNQIKFNSMTFNFDPRLFTIDSTCEIYFPFQIALISSNSINVCYLIVFYPPLISSLKLDKFCEN